MGKTHFATVTYSYENKGPTYKINMSIDLKRFEKQYSKAQYELDSMVMRAMKPFMPMESGTFIRVTKGMSQAIAGSGKVYAAAPPFGRFLYNGVVMVGERSRSVQAKRGEKKVVTSRALDYSRAKHPDVQSHWFEAAKKEYGDKWIAKTKKLAGGGSNGWRGKTYRR